MRDKLYTREFRLNCVNRRLESLGEIRLDDLCKELGVPRGTLTHWVKIYKKDGDITYYDKHQIADPKPRLARGMGPQKEKRQKAKAPNERLRELLSAKADKDEHQKEIERLKELLKMAQIQMAKDSAAIVQLVDAAAKQKENRTTQTIDPLQQLATIVGTLKGLGLNVTMQIDNSGEIPHTQPAQEQRGFLQ